MKASDYVYTLNHQSPNHTNKKQESADKLVVQQIINQNVAKKNLRNPDYFSTSIISSTTNSTDFNQYGNSKIGSGIDEYQKMKKEFESAVIQNMKKEGNIKSENYQNKMANFQKNYEEFYRGYTPDVKSFKKYAEIQKNMSQSNSETIDIDQMKNDEEFKKNLQIFYGEEVSKSKNQRFAPNKIISHSKKETELVKSLQSSKYNPITGK